MQTRFQYAEYWHVHILHILHIYTLPTLLLPGQLTPFQVGFQMFKIRHHIRFASGKTGIVTCSTYSVRTGTGRYTTWHMLWYCTTLFCSVQVRTFYLKYVPVRTFYPTGKYVPSTYFSKTYVLSTYWVQDSWWKYVLEAKSTDFSSRKPVRTGTYRVHTGLIILVPHFSCFWRVHTQYILILGEYVLWVPDSIARQQGCPSGLLASDSGTGPRIELNHIQLSTGRFIHCC